MGSVFEVEHLGTGEFAALKLLHARAGLDARAVERFRREARIAVRLKGEHVVRVLDADVADELGGAPFLVMELLAGADLGAVAGNVPQPPALVVEWLRQAARGIDRAHALGVVHRDLKPENLFLTTSDAGAPLVKVLDFGIAKLMKEDLLGAHERGATPTATGAIFGTPLYMSPEQAVGEALGPSSDLWALAMVAYRLLAGEPYWRAASPAHVLAQIVYEPLRPPSACGRDLGDAFDRWFLRSCRRAPGSRWPSAGAQIEALGEALEGRRALPPRASDVGDGPTAPRVPRDAPPDDPVAPRADEPAAPAPRADDGATADAGGDGGLVGRDGGGADARGDGGLVGRDGRGAAGARALAGPREPDGAFGARAGGATTGGAVPGEGREPAENAVRARAAAPRRRRAAVRAGGAAVVAAFVGAAALVWRGPARAPGGATGPVRAAARPYVLVLPFRGAGTPWPAMVSELVAEQLRAGDAVRSPPPDARIEMAGEVGASSPPTAAELARLRRTAGVDFAVAGDVREQGGTVRARLEVYDAARGVPVAELLALSGPASDPAAFAREAGARVRRLLGRPQLSAADDAALRSSLPDDPSATAEYVQALDAARRFHDREAVAHFEAALRRAPRFAPAWAGLALTYQNLGRREPSRSAAERAAEFAPELPRADELAVQAAAALARNEWARAAETYGLLAQFYPDRVDHLTSFARALVNGGHGAEALAALERARGRSLTDWERMRVAFATAYARERLSEPAGQLAALREAGALAEANGARVAAAEALRLEGEVHLRAGRADEARALLDRARPVLEGAGAAASALRCDSGLARIAELEGDFERAVELYEAILARRREGGDDYGVARETVQVGIVYAMMGRWAEARARFDEGGALFEAFGDREGVAHRELNVAAADLERGDAQGARERIARGRALHEAIGYRAGVAEADGLLGRLAWAEGDLAGAEAAYERAYREAGESSESELVADVALARARVAHEAGRPAEGERFEDARRAVEAAASARLGALFAAHASRRSLALGDRDGARRLALESEARARRARSVDVLAFALAAALAAPDEPAGGGSESAERARRRDELARLLDRLEAVEPRLEALDALGRAAADGGVERAREAVRLAEAARLPLRALAARARLGLALGTAVGARDAAAAEARLRRLGAVGLARAGR
jgi:serine/threonine-protein kinase